MALSALKVALKNDRYMRYIDGVLKTYRRKGWSKMTKEEKGEYTALVEVFNENKELFAYEDQLFYALGKYPELDEAFKSGKFLDEALFTKAFNKKIDTTVDDYIKRMEDMIKGAESGEYTYTTDDIYALLEELAEEGLPELIKDRQSLNMLANADQTIDGAGRLDVLVDAVDQIRQKFAYVDDTAALTRMDKILFNLRQSRQHIDNLDDVQTNKPKMDWRDTDVFNGEDASGFADPSINDYSINSDMRFNAVYKNVADEAKYTPIESAEYKFVLQEDVWPLPPETKKTQPKTGGIIEGGKGADETGYAYVERLQTEKAAAEQQKYRGQSMQKGYKHGTLSVEDNREGTAIVEEAEATIKRIQELLDAYLGITKKQGGGFIDSPLYLRDY
jgi:murein DD-endopeptidase MepM/ murein hydrolase activator NlpD